jgi:predicted nucleic acid-binding protein
VGENLMYLIDTNILIYHINEDIPPDSRSELKQIFKNHFNISVITKMEFLGFKKHTEKSFKESNKFLENADVIGLDDEIIDIVISLKREMKIKLPDAIIAATAKKKEWTLVTRNDKDFKDIELNIYNPFV